MDAKGTPAATDKPEQAHDARVGDTLTLSGQNDGEQLDVTVKKWLDPAKGADEFTTPGSGKRWVAVQLQLTNTGTTEAPKASKVATLQFTMNSGFADEIGQWKIG
ncbi:hypothetical protein [Streptomyces rhizosphaericus]|uniref:DUF4352 domain-containing protein n=1 Tax=Streptomyces rhizosphaericus TaxID=114699 RepID=A0A6G4ADX4_9ACTN|nr:hypothetical protein [Streptomyces rhizosphaericus]NEW70687.1 hypothetical protein [Streptomyces rhizosphaericus]